MTKKRASRAMSSEKKMKSDSSMVDSSPNLEHIDIELTRDCNLDCIHCSTGLDREGEELTVEQTIKLLQEGEPLGLSRIGLTGGEPFLRFGKMASIVDYCRKNMEVNIHVHSNGTKILSKEAQWVKQSNVDITVSIFGINPKTHDSVTRRSGSMGLTLRGIRNLVSAEANLTAFIVPMKTNFKEVPSLVKMLDAEGVKRIRLLSLSPTGKAKKDYSSLELTKEQMRYLRDELRRLQKRGGIEIAAGFCTRIDFPELGCVDGHDRCYAAKNRIHIDAFGNVFPCTASSGIDIFSVGNVRQTKSSLSEIWRYSQMFDFLRSFRNHSPSICKKCVRLRYCKSGCRVKVSHMFGDTMIASPYCNGPFS